MKKSCGAWFATYLVLAAATGLIVYRRLPEPGLAVGAAVVGGGIAWMALAYFAGIAKKFAAARMIRRALGSEVPRDGEKIAAIGRIGPSGGSALTSPLSRSSCVAYKYEIRSGLGEHDFTYFDGFALTPSAIQGRQRSVRLLAWPDLNMSWTLVPPSIAQANAEEYIRDTEFREPTVLNFRRAIADITAIYKDDDGSVRWDQRGLRPPLDTTKPLNLQSATYRERLLRAGDSVCAIGRYSAQRGGIVPSDHPLIDPVTIEVGAEDAFVRRAYGGAVGYFIGGLIFSAIFVTALVGFLAFVPLEATEQRRPSMIASWPEIRLERLLDRRVRPLMHQAGMLSDDNIVIAIPRGSANGRVKSGSREEVVSRAALLHRGDERTINVDDGTLVLTIDPQGRPLHLTLLGTEVSVAAAQVEIKENGKDEVAGRVTILPDDPKATACRVTFRAS